MRFSAFILPLSLVAAASASVRTFGRRAAFTLQNGKDAQKLNAQFQSLTKSSECTSGQTACVGGDFAQCVDGKFVTTPCSPPLKCFALPLVNSAGTSLTCDTEANAKDRIQASGATGGLNGKRGLEARATSPPACAAKNKKRADTTPALATLLRRTAQQDLPQVAQSWQDLCLASGGDITTNQPCVKLAGQDGISALLANADVCAQQDNADAMVDFAKSKGVTNKDALIANAIAYREHPRNSINNGGVTPSTPFCQKKPRNSELDGVVNGQLAGNDPGLFGSPNTETVAFGASGTCPLGKTPDVDTCTCN